MRGHIRRRGNGYAVVVDLPRGPDGRRRRRWVQVNGTEADAHDTLIDLLHKIRREGWEGSDHEPVASFTQRWLEAVDGTVKPSTLDFYRSKLAHLVAHYGDRPLRRLDPAALQRMHRTLTAGGLSPRSVHHVHRVTRRMLRDAVRWGILTRNPADLIDPPKVPAVEMRTWTAEQTGRFLDATKDDWCSVGWRLAATTGMRRGELAGLQWDDLDGNRLTVRRSVTMTGNRPTVQQGTKTGRSRTLTLDAETVAQLHRYRVEQRIRQIRVGGGGPWLLAYDDGRPVSPDWLTRRFRALCEQAGVPTIRLHDVRHTYATLALRAGVHPRVVAERLGHTTVTVTLDTYSHAVPELEAEAAERVAGMIGDTSNL